MVFSLSLFITSSPCKLDTCHVTSLCPLYMAQTA